MRLKKCGEKIVAVSGLGIENGIEVEIELVEVCGNESIWINGAVHKMTAGKVMLPLSLFDGKSNAIKVYSGGAWYLLEGIRRDGSRLLLSDEYVDTKVTELSFEVQEMKSVVSRLQKTVKVLEALCSGEDFL